MNEASSDNLWLPTNVRARTDIAVFTALNRGYKMKYLSMLISFTKHLFLLLILLAVARVYGQDIAPPISESAHANAPSLTIESEACPSDFYQVAIPAGGKLCQIFATDLPASMVFYVPENMHTVVDFYQSAGQLGAAQEVNQRFVMRSSDTHTTVIVSADGAGSQVDVLVKQHP